MSLIENERYKLNSFSEKIYYNINEIFISIKENIFRKNSLRPTFLYANSQNLLGNNLTGVEIGIYKGKNALSILQHLSINTLYLVDPYINYYENDHDRLVTMPPNIYQDAKKSLKKYSDKIMFIKTTSEDAIDFIPNNLDFVYIDGNHDYNFVKKDVELYSKKIKKGGFLGFDDISFESVSRVAIETIDSLDFEPVYGCIDCLKKI